MSVESGNKLPYRAFENIDAIKRGEATPKQQKMAWIDFMQLLEAKDAERAEQPEGPAPDKGCYTLPDGSCVSPGPCMHTPREDRQEELQAVEIHDGKAYIIGIPAECSDEEEANGEGHNCDAMGCPSAAAHTLYILPLDGAEQANREAP